MSGDETTIRTPDQRLRVFISSTMKELAAERAAAREAVRSLRLTPVLFELGARPHPPRDLYRAYLEQSDIFVGIYAREYGWVAPDMEVSGIEDEYTSASGKPRLVYVRAEEERDARLKELLGRIADSGEVSYKRFGTSQELGDLLADDLSLLITERFQHPAPDAAERENPVPHLPSYATSLVGRERELTEIEALLGDGATRLLTLTGPGGTGKTRLAVEAAVRLSPRFTDGAQLVPLDALRDPSLFSSALASALGVQEFGPVRLLNTVKAQVRDRRMLLILDNFEQIIEAAPDVAELVRDLPQLRLLVTSREPLQVSGEHEYPVHPLATDASAGESGAVRLFVERARAVRPDFALTDENAATIADICRELDGLPLAIELAAARMRVLSPAIIHSRLREGLDVLAGTARDAPQRQSTMRNAIGWSYELLEPPEQETFRCLAVFSGGFTLSAAEAVTAGVPGDTLDVLASLVAKSLVLTQDPEDEEPRFGMLEMIREYAGERLQEAGETQAARDEHCRYFAELAERHELTLVSPEALRYRFVFEREYPNFRLAAQWAIERVAGPDFDREHLVRLLFFLYFFWYFSGRLTEGHELAERAVQATAALPESPAHAAALFTLATMTMWQGDLRSADAAGEQSLAIWRKHSGRLHDTATSHLATCLTSLNMGDVERARRVFRDCLDLLRQTDDRGTEVIVLLHLGDVELMAGDPEAARAMYEEGLALQNRLGPGWPIAALENNFGELARYEGRHEEAEPHYRVALQWFEELASVGNIARTKHNLGYVALRRGDVAGAKDLLREAFDLFRKLGNRRGMAECLQGLAAVAVASGDTERAARMLGAAEAHMAALQAHLWPADARERERELARVVEELGADAADKALAAGRALSPEQAAELIA